MTDFIDKDTIIEAAWLNSVDATVFEALQSATTATAVRAAIDVPQETQEVAPQVRVNGAWIALSSSAPALHAASHISGGADELDHDALLNGAGDNHIPHTSVGITAGSGLTGGGDISVSRTIAFSYVLEQALNAGGFKISNLLDPGAANDACTKGYADNLVLEAGANPWQAGVTPNSIYYSTGFVGIGTDTPIADLDVRGTSQVTGDAVFGTDIDVTGSVNAATIYATGDVGIGTDTPSDTLDVVGGATVRGALSLATALGYERIITDGVSDRLLISGSANTSTTTGAYLEIRGLDYGGAGLGGDVLFHLPTAGNVGIGTASPAEKLDVVGNVLATGSISGGDIVSTGTVTTVDVVSIGTVTAVDVVSTGTVTVVDMEVTQASSVTTPAIIGPDSAWSTDNSGGGSVIGFKYRKLADGVVIINIGGTPTGTLPVGYRPGGTINFAVLDTATGDTMRITVSGLGGVSADGGTIYGDHQLHFFAEA